MPRQYRSVEPGLTETCLSSSDWSNTDSMVLQILANMLASQNREQKAVELLEYVLTRQPDNLAVIKALGGVYLLVERHEEALEMIERYERSVPEGGNHDDVLMVKGQVLWALGHETEATAVVNSYLTKKAKQ